MTPRRTRPTRIPHAPLVAIDGSLRSPGWACWGRDGQGRPTAAGQPPSPLPKGGAYDYLCDVFLPTIPCNVVVEWPQDYPGRAGTAGDLERIRDLYRSLAHTFKDHRFFGYYPATWKGNVPKLITARRLSLQLYPGENPPWPLSENDTWDAIGLGLWFMGITKRGCILQGTPSIPKTRPVWYVPGIGGTCV
jgi:hypothetical protein